MGENTAFYQCTQNCHELPLEHCGTVSRTLEFSIRYAASAHSVVATFQLREYQVAILSQLGRFSWCPTLFAADELAYRLGEELLV